mgnify:CR=1 FL=1
MLNFEVFLVDMLHFHVNFTFFPVNSDLNRRIFCKVSSSSLLSEC